MLEFLNNNQVEKPCTGSGTDPQAAGTENEYIKVAASDRKVRKTNYMLGGLFCVGLIGLLVMMRTSGPTSVNAQEGTSSAEQAQIEVTIARLTGAKTEIFDGISQVVDKFDQFSDIKQVCVESLLKNPFEMDHSKGRVAGKLGDDPGKNDRLMTEQIKQNAEKLQLLTIMYTSDVNTRSCCMIDDKLLYEGDSIGGFRVFQIGKNYVKLESNGVEVTLKLSFD